jgi:hypothetical protein
MDQTGPAGQTGPAAWVALEPKWLRNIIIIIRVLKVVMILLISGE